MKRRALITGCTGQDGSYLAEFLLEKDYEVYGLIRRRSTNGMQNLQGILDRLRLIPGDMTDQGSLERALKLANPQEIYNLAAQSFVGQSFDMPLCTADITGLGTLRLFEAVRLHCPSAKVYQASSSEQFGSALTAPQDESTPFNPISPYGCAKTFAHFCALLYQRSFHLFIACGIAFNHESERRGEGFVSRKISQGVARIKYGRQQTLSLGNLHAKRDWSHALDMVEAYWRLLQLKEPHTVILASGNAHSVTDFLTLACRYADIDEKKYIVEDSSLLRPWDIPCLVGNATLAKKLLDWSTTISFIELVQRMVEHDLQTESEAFARDSIKTIR